MARYPLLERGARLGRPGQVTQIIPAHLLRAGGAGGAGGARDIWVKGRAAAGREVPRTHKQPPLEGPGCSPPRTAWKNRLNLHKSREKLL